MKSQKGQSIVETALIIPVILILLFGIVDFGRIFHAYLTLDHASREIARVAVVDESKIEETFERSTSTLNGNLTKAVSYEGGNQSGNDVTVKLTYQVDFLTPIIGQFIGPFPLTDTTVMRVE